MEIEATLEQEIRKGQLTDAKITEIKILIGLGKAPNFTEDDQGTVWFRKKICIPDVDRLHELILKEPHDSAYSIHQDVPRFKRKVLVVWFEKRCSNPRCFV